MTTFDTIKQEGMKTVITHVDIERGTFSATVNGRWYHGSFDNEYYMPNKMYSLSSDCKKNTTLSIRCSTMFALEAFLKK